jgi:hypothetical protein
MRYTILLAPLAIAALIAACVSHAFAADEIRTERVQFKPGANGATVKGKIKGYEVVDYVLEAGKGQSMNVSMATDNTASYFNILPPGSTGAAIFIGSTKGNQFEGTLPASGDYKIRVYMMRSAARRNEVANYRLEMIVTGAASKANAGPAAAKSGDVTLADLKGMDAIKAIDEMTALGFTNVDTITSGETIYGIYYNRSTKQCIQLTNADNQVYAVNDIKTHPKCR